MATVLDQLVVDIIFRGDRKELDKFEQGVKNLNQQLNKVARGFAVAGAALTAALVGVAKISLTHEQAVNNLRVLNKLTEEQIALLEKQAQKEGAEGRFDSKDVLAAQHELIRAGWDHNQVLDEMTHIIAFATAGELDLAIAAQQVVGQLGQMDLEASGTEQAVNFMGKAFQNSNVALGNFSRLTQSVNENARQAGFSIEEITAASLHLGKEAGGASRAFQTAFADMEMVLKELLDLTPEGASILDSFDIDPKDVGAIGLPEFLRRVAELSQEQLQEVFGTEYWSKVKELVGASDIEAIGELHRNLTTDMEGTIQAMADAKNLGAPGAWEDLKSAINALNVSLGKAGILSLLERAFNTFRKFIDAITNAPGPVLAVIAAIIGMGPALLAIGAGLKLVTFALNGLVPLLKAAAWANTKFGISAKLAALWNSNLILSLRLAAITVTNFAKKHVTRAVTSLKSFATTIWTSSVGALRALGRRLAMASLAMLRFATRAIVAGISAVITFGVAIWASLIPPLIAATAAVVGFTLALLANPVVLIVAAIIGAFVALGFVVYKFRRQIVGALKTALSWVKGNWPLLVGILFGPFGIAAGLIFKFRDDIVGAIMWIKDKIMAIFTSLRDFIIGIWEGLGEGLAGAFRGVINAVINGLNKALKVAAGLIEGIKGSLDKIPGPNPAGDFLLGVASKLRAGIPNFAIGGMVPGATGRPMLATVHGGEMVLPPSAWQVVMDLFEGFKRGPAALPQAPYHYGQMYRSSVTNRTVNINITEPIVIQTQATDAKGIAQELHEAIEDKIRNIAYDHDGPVER